MSEEKPVADTEHAPPAGLDDFNPETKKAWSLWVEMVYDTLIDPEKYAKLSTGTGNPTWTNDQLSEIDPNNELCRDQDEYSKDVPPVKNDNSWKSRPPLNRFYNKNDPKNEGKFKSLATKKVEWSTFPRIMNYGVFVGRNKNTGRLKLVATEINDDWRDPNAGPKNSVYWAADQYRIYQDEYLEWAVTRDEATGKLKKITFTCEGQEYWSMLAKKQPETVIELYKKFVGEKEAANITKESLWTAEGPDGPDGEKVYNPYNKWNSPNPTNGFIGHLIHPNSTLGAEITIVADGTVKREWKENPDWENNAKDLCRHAGFGEYYRNSDPQIGWDCYNTCGLQGEGKHAITVKEPVGLYIQHWDSTALLPPKGVDFDVTTCWKPVRPEKHIENGPWVRVEFEVPEGHGFVLGDLRIKDDNGGTKKLEYGSQIAELIFVGVEAEASEFVGGPKDKPASDTTDWERLAEVVKTDNPDEEYDIDRSRFLHYMQYKAIRRAKLAEEAGATGSPWFQWVKDYPNLRYVCLEKGGQGNVELDFPEET